MNQVTLRIIEGPDYRRDDDGWEHNAYTIELRYEGRRARFPWRQGLGITEDPSPQDVLECLFLDASSYDNARDFADWAAEYGYDSDSRKAYALYQAVGREASKLARLFGVSDHQFRPWMDEDSETLARKYAAA